jgi:hypothetical protein
MNRTEITILIVSTIGLGVGLMWLADILSRIGP